MTARKSYVATAPDGTRVTRSTHREYAFAVLVGPSDRSPKWGAWSFSSRRELAERELVKARAAWANEAEVVLVAAVQS